MTAISETIYVLSDHPELYENDLGALGSQVVYLGSSEGLLAHLAEENQGGLVLEVGKVMEAPSRDRDRIFSYASSLPVLRTRIQPGQAKPVYLDNLDCFLANCTAATDRRLRCRTRVKVDIPCEISAEDDPMMARAFPGTLLDISSAGGFIATDAPVDKEHFVHVRIPSLDNPRPIYSSLRWVSPGGENGPPAGVGVLFVDVLTDQDEQIAREYVFPAGQEPA